MELLFTEAQSYMEIAPPTEREAIANTSIAEQAVRRETKGPAAHSC